MAASHEEKKAVIFRNIRYGVSTAVAIFLLGVFVWPMYSPAEKLDSVGDRLVHCIRWQFLSVLTVLFGIRGVARVRSKTNAIDPINGQAEDELKVEAKFLQNTLEQFVLSFVGHLVLSTYLSPTSTTVIPTLVIIFVTGRIFFWIGYHRDPLQRSVGFSMTFIPTVVVYVYVAYCLLFKGPRFGL